MRKWLVGLLAAALCASSAWAEGTATLPVSENYTSSQDWTTLTGFSGSGVGSYGDGRCKFDSNNDWLMVQFDGTPGMLTFDLKGNSASSGTAPASFLVEESADAETWSQLDNLDETKISSSEYTSFSYALAGESRYVRWTFANKYGFNFGLNNVAISSGGPAEFSVTFDKENWFKVALGEASSVTAIPKNGIEPYTFLWESDTPELNGGTTDTLQIPDTLEEGDYTVACLVTEDNGEGDAINALIGFTVEAIPVLSGDDFARITSADGLQDGTRIVLTDPDGAYALPAVVASSVFDVAEVTPVGDVITTEEAGIIWTLVADGEGNFSLYNEGAEKYAGHAGTDSNSGRLQDEAFPNTIAISDAEAGLFSVTSIAADAKGAFRSLQYNYNSGKPRFAYYKGTQKNLRIYAADSGPATLSVKLTPSTEFTVVQNEEAAIMAEAKNASEDVYFVWNAPAAAGSGDGSVFSINSTEIGGPYEVTCTAIDGEEQASASVTFSVVAPPTKYQIACAVGIPNGSVSADKTEAEEGELVTLTATPAAGYKLEHFLVNDIAISANTFPMPAEDVLVSASFVEKPVGVGFTKITSLDELTEGEYVITGAKAAGEEYAMMASISTGSTKFLERRETAVELEEDVVTDAEDSIIWTLAQGDDGWTIYNEAVGYAGYVASGNSSGAEAEPSTKSSWTITAGDSEGLFLLTNVGNTGRYLLYNASSPRFACYEKTTSGKQLALYKGTSGPATFSIKLSPASYFEVEVGAEATITATPKSASGDVTYAWTIGGTPVDATGAVLTLDTTAATEVIEVVCTATDGAGAEATASVSYKVVAPAPKYQIACAIGIPNGSVSADKTEAEEGELVTLTATPAAGYKLEHFLVNDIAISANTFPMPAEDVLVSASFVEKPVGVGFTKITSLDELTEGEYVITGAKAAGEEYAMMASISTGSTKFLERRETAVELEEDVVTDAEDSIIWTLAQGDDGWTIYNEAVGYAGYVASGNSSGAEAEPSTKSSWTITAGDSEGLFLLTNVGNTGRYLLYNASSPRFACYEKTTSGKQLALYKGTSGPATFSIKLSPASYFEVEVGAEATITATPKSASGDVTYAWTIGGTPVDATGAVLTLDTTAATEVIEVVCTATDGAGAEATASVSYKVVAPAPKFQVGIAIGIPNGSVSADKTEAEEGELVTLTASPAVGYKLETFLLDGEPISGNSFEMPAKDVLVSASFVEITGDQFTLVTSLDDLEDGAEYVITDNSQAYAMKAELSTTSTKRLLNEPVAPVEGVITTDDAAIVWKLVEDEDGNFAFYSDSIGKYIGWSSGNSAKFQDDAFANTISYEDELFVVMATSTADLEKPRKLQFNSAANALQFAYYEGSQKNLCFFKKSGASAPKIVLSGGETTIELGESFDLNFELKNYDGDFEWVVDSREGGTIAQDGNYTWTPSETGEVTIKVVARNGELDIASKEVPLTVTEPGPQPGEPAIQFAVITDPCVVGQPVTFKVWSINVTSDPTVYPDGFDASGAPGSQLTDGDINYGEESDYRVVSFTPDAVGTYVFSFVTGEEGAADEVRDSVTITVTGGEGPVIDGTTVTKVSFANGFTATATGALKEEFTNVKAQRLEWNGSKDSGFEPVGEELLNQATWPEMKFDLDDPNATLRFIFVK